nr:tetratricopeptide repeat protein [Hallella mizrahii]
MGKCYYNGVGIDQNNNLALYWYRKAADQGLVNAQTELGDYYYGQDGVFQSIEKLKQAVTWYKKAAEQGNDYAQYSLAYCYYNGKGVDTNYPEAVKWYRKAAAQGYDAALYELGQCYYEGNGVAKNYQEAVKLFRQAIDKGNEDAQLALAECYLYGRGVKKNLDKAIGLYQPLADKGNGSAKEGLRNVEAARRAPAIDRAQNQYYNTIVRKYGAKAANAMLNGRPYVGMPEGVIRDFVFVDGDGIAFNAYGFSRLVQGYKLYLPTTRLAIYIAAGNIKAPRWIYCQRGRVSAIKW